MTTAKRSLNLWPIWIVVVSYLIRALIKLNEAFNKRICVMNLNKLDDEDDMEHDRFEDGAFISQINAWCSKQMKLAAAYALENSSCFLAVRQKPGIALCVISGNIDETAKEFLLSEIILSELENEYFRADDLITELQRIIEIAKQHPSMTA